MQASATVFRIDRFSVPTAVLPDFMSRLRRIENLLAGQPGCLQNRVLVATDSAAEFNVLTLVEWAHAEAMAAARAAAQAQYSKEGFDPAAFMRQLGVRADLGSFEPTQQDLALVRQGRE